MDRENEETQINKEDILFLEKEFSKVDKPLSLAELTKKFVYRKTAYKLSQQVKKYDASCRYEVGDLIYKEYDEPLMVSSKGVEPFSGRVVLEVVNKSDYKNFNCDMLEVDYSGGGPFRKHIDYMKKTKTQVLLPCNLDKKGPEPEILKKEDDPRLDQLPMTERDIKKLEKNLKSLLSKSPQFFSWNDYWQLKEKKIDYAQEKIKKIEAFILETKTAVETKDLVSQFFDLKSEDDLFPLSCLSLNHLLEKKYKKDFVYVSHQNWGKWNLKKVLNSFLKELPLSASKAKLPLMEREKRPSSTREFPLKIYLTWREILSGGLKIPVSYNTEFSKYREYIFTDPEGEKDYIAYYYPPSYFFLGLKEFYEENNVPQGSSLTLEKKNANHFHFWLKKSKKKISVAKIVYHPEEDEFADTGEEVFTFSLPNKIIHLQRETLKKVISIYDQRDDRDLRELMILIFKNFGLGRDKFSLHYLRAYHLVDMLKQTSEEDVEATLLHSPEFKKSEKKKGLFIYQEKIRMKEEEEIKAPPEVVIEPEPREKIEEAPPEAPFEKEVPPAIEEERREEIRVEAPSAVEEIAIKEPPDMEKPPPKKEKEAKKRKAKIRMEGEKAPRRRKGERRIIEEKIELEESEQEALIAVKAKDKKEAAEERFRSLPEEKKKEFKPYVSEEPVFGVFAEKLKDALDEKQKKKKKK